MEKIINDIQMDNTQLYMTFQADSAHRNDVIESIFGYAQNVCTNGYGYFSDNLIRCPKASTSSVQWYYDSAKPGDRYCSMFCASPKSGLKISVFVNSRNLSGYSKAEEYHVRLALSQDKKNSKYCRGRMGMLQNNSQVQDYEDSWAKVATESDVIEIGQTA